MYSYVIEFWSAPQNKIVKKVMFIGVEKRYAKSIHGKSTMLIPTIVGGYPVLEKEILNQETDKFTMVHNRIIDTRLLNNKEKAAYMVLKSFCFDTDICWPSEEYLAHLLDCDAKTVRGYVKKLKELKLITTLTIREGKDKTTKYYLLLPSSEWLLEKDSEVREVWKASQREWEEVREE